MLSTTSIYNDVEDVILAERVKASNQLWLGDSTRSFGGGNMKGGQGGNRWLPATLVEGTSIVGVEPDDTAGISINRWSLSPYIPTSWCSKT